MEKMKMESINLTDENINKIEELFPNCITESLDKNGKLKKAVDFEKLKLMLSSNIAEGNEKYEFTWVGKKASIIEANKPIRKTLRPVKEESVNWDNTKNLYIEGDNLEALKLLQESYLGKVKMIYIDPPYNTGNDFIYNDNFKINVNDYADNSGEVDESGNRLFKNTDSNGRFHSDWCSMMYSRLVLARNMLSNDGVIFASISEFEVDNLKKMCIEVFGEKNYITTLVRKTKTTSNNGNQFAPSHEYIVVCAKKLETLNVFMAILMLVSAPYLAPIFVSNANSEIERYVIEYFSVIAPCYLLLGLIVVYRTADQSMNISWAPLVACILELIGRCLGSILLAKSLGYIGIVISHPLAWILSDIIVVPVYFIYINKLNKKELRKPSF